MLKKFTLTFLLILCSVIPQTGLAATLSLSSNTTTVDVGNFFTISVKTNTQDKYINNGEAIIEFPTDLLEVVSVSKTSSVFSMWVEEPSFSNTTGIISFNGGVVTPGFKGNSGTLATITFRAKKEGSATLSFLSGSLRENDGFGTDILSSKTGTTITIQTVESDTDPIPSVAPKPQTQPKTSTDEDVSEEVVDMPIVLIPPQISLSSEEISRGEWVTIFGKSNNSGQKVNIYLEKPDYSIEQHTLDVSAGGLFSYSTNTLDSVGTISIWAQDILEDESLGESSEKAYLRIFDKNIIEVSIHKGRILLGGAMLVLIIVFAYIGWHMYFNLKRKYNKK